MVEASLNWIKKNRLEFFLIVAILLAALFLRIYRLPEYMTFLGDEGRDALMIKRILVDGDIPLLGPPTSVGNIYLGPLYYYLMAIPMAIFWLNPVAAAAQVAIIGVLTVGLIYYLSRQWFGKWAAFTSAVLYAISPVNIIYSRSSWNPNPAPFFALLAILGIYKVNKTGNFLWLILTGIALAFVVQMHYLALILLPVFGLLWIYQILKRDQKKYVLLGTVGAIIAFLFLMSPLVIFDLKYDYLNYKSITTFFSNRETTVNLNPLNTLGRVVPIYNHNLVGRYITQESSWLTPLASILIILPVILALLKKIKVRWPYLTLGLWLAVGVSGLALYKQNVYDHYLGFLNPVPYLLLGALTALAVKNIGGRLILGLIIGAVVLLNLQNSPLKNPPNNQLKRTQEVAKYVIEQAEGKPFNFALIAKSNYDAAYQFYLDMYGFKPKKVPFEVTDQLIVVCEDPVCDPVVNPKQEISHFGMTKVEKESEFMGVKVYKLIHAEKII